MEHSFELLLLELTLVLAIAKAGGLAAQKIRLPMVLGELFAGMLVGNLGFLGIGFFEGLRHDPYLGALAELGVILLMFEVGVECTVPELLKVGLNAVLVACVGVIVPFVLGFGAIYLFFPRYSVWIAIFLGATLCATSVGISARVLKDMNRVKTQEGRTILGAAVVDDILGLVILAAVVALIGSDLHAGGKGAAVIVGETLLILGKAFGFLIVAILLGVLFSKRLYRWAARLQTQGVFLTLSLVLCFVMAYLAHQSGLASIIGAFAAGLILEPEHSRIFMGREKESLEHLLLPLSTIFVPIFFFHVGIRVELGALLSLEPLMMGLLLSLVAVAGKMACAAGVVRNAGQTDRWTVAMGMVPRGEVGLIFAGIGAGLQVGAQPLLSSGLYAAVILMVFVTTAMTPPLMTRRLSLRPMPLDNVNNL
jgi:Kef-type K+ transport system membrane component KefB